MSPFYDLLDELLTMVIILLVTSSDGAVDLARLAATCTKFRAFAEKSAILKVVNFDGIPFGDFAAHHHAKDLLLCARAGNVAAESRVAKALLHRDNFFWTIILEHDKPLLAANPQAAGILSHRKLIRSFIRHANYEEISKTRSLLCSYTLMFLGCQQAHEKAPYEAKAAKKKSDYEKVLAAYNKKQESMAEEDDESEKSKSEVDEESGQDGGDDDEDEEEEEEEDDD